MQHAGRLALLAAAILALLIVAPDPGGAAQVRQETITLARPLPGPVVPPGVYRQAVEKDTRTASGAPGAKHWQIGLSYEIDARLDPRTALLTATETVHFENGSPDEIPYLMLHLHQNLHRQGVARNRPNEITGGVTLHRVTFEDEEMFEVSDEEAVGYRVQGALVRLKPAAPIAPGQGVTMQIAWSFTVPQNSSGRMGHSNREIYFIGYWFPKVGVYDDLRGWDADPYLGGAEFYDAFADYRVQITVPVDWTVMATGTLRNASDVFSEQTRERLARAAMSDELVQVASPADREAKAVTAQPASGALTYRFHAQNVRDFTWTSSNMQVWNATSARVPDRDGDGAEDRVAIHSFFRPERAPLWEQQWLYGKQAIEFLSAETGLTYPWPHMTSVEGTDIIGGGMEFPMLTVIGPYLEREARNLFGVTVHEIAHMWTPLIIGSNEKRHAWMDEGFASFLTNQAMPDYWPDAEDSDVGSRDSYLATARDEAEGPMMTHGDYYEVGYGTASYAKPATLLVTLRNLLGAEVFEGAVHTYFQEWKFKHPAPWDFFATVERAAGVDLDWFWSSWYYTTWTLDHAVGSVDNGGDGARIVIEDRGFAPMPAIVRIETASGEAIERTVPVSHWLTGAATFEIDLPASAGEVVRVVIDPELLFPDMDRANNSWPEESAAEETSGD